jgi:hypothetical protein
MKCSINTRFWFGNGIIARPSKTAKDRYSIDIPQTGMRQKSTEIIQISRSQALPLLRHYCLSRNKTS